MDVETERMNMLKTANSDRDERLTVSAKRVHSGWICIIAAMNTNKTMKVIAHDAIKTEKAETCFTRLYGRAAYESWKAREAALTVLFKAGGHSKREICRLR